METSKFRTQMEMKGTSIFRSKKLEQVSVSQLLSFAAQPIKASLVQLLPEASKQAVEMFQLVMKYMGDYPTRLSQSKYDALPAKTIQMAIDNRELRDEYNLLNLSKPSFFLHRHCRTLTRRSFRSFALRSLQTVLPADEADEQEPARQQQ